MKFTNLNIGSRLYLGFTAVVVIFLLILSSVFANFERVGAASAMNAHTYKVAMALDEILTALTNMETGQRGYALTGKEASLEPFNTGKAEFIKQVGILRTLTAGVTAQEQRIQKLLDLQQRWAEGPLGKSIALRRAVEAGQNQIGDVVTLEQAGKGKADMDAMRELLNDAKDRQLDLLEERVQDYRDLRNLTLMTIGIGAILAIIVAFLVSLVLKRGIVRPLNRAVEIAETVAAGDLTSHIEIDRKDELGKLMHALKVMNDGLLDIVLQVRTGTGVIAAASKQIANGNLDLSSRTERQASSLEETASSMEELTSTVRHNATNAAQANQLAIAASEVAGSGGQLVSRVIDTMSAINASSSKIVDIISVIDGIAFQTNILALNAAVEAARAGEQGRGFAVVAGEVRTLAQRSASAAKEIKELINHSVSEVDAGSRLVEDAGKTMDKVVESVKNVTDIVGEISSSSSEQSNGIEQVNQAVMQIDEITQQNAALVEEAAAAAQSMQDQASSLARAASVFKVHVSDYMAAHAVESTPAFASTQTSSARPAPRAPSPALVKTTAAPVVAAPAKASAKEPVLGTTANGDEWEQF